jgi:hypothetical protein
VDAAAPVVPTLTDPRPSQPLAAASPGIHGTAEPGSTVSVYVDGETAPACTVVAAENGAWSCRVSAVLIACGDVLSCNARGNCDEAAQMKCKKDREEGILALGYVWMNIENTCKNPEREINWCEWDVSRSCLPA